MRTVTVPICDSCGDAVLKPSDGFTITGRIYTAITDRHGVDYIGRILVNTPESAAQVEERFVYHRNCLTYVLGFNPDGSTRSEDTQNVGKSDPNSTLNDDVRERVFHTGAPVLSLDSAIKSANGATLGQTRYK
jgi:hypothetical protein